MQMMKNNFLDIYFKSNSETQENRKKADYYKTARVKGVVI